MSQSTAPVLCSNQPSPAQVAGLHLQQKTTATGKILRPYQVEAVSSLFQEAQRARALQLAGSTEKVPPCCVSQPTAAGKSLEFYRFAIEVREAWGWRTLLIVPTRTLVEQSVRNAGCELGSGWKIGHIGDGVCEFRGCHFVVATAASFDGTRGKERLAQLITEGFEIVIFDECHHVAAPTWEATMDALWQSAQLVAGFTATIVRGDGVSVASERYFRKVVCHHSVAQLVDWGYLAQCYGHLVHTGIDLKQVRLTRKGDYNERDLDAAVNVEAVNKKAVDAWLRYGRNGKTVVFCVSVAHSQALAKAFQEAGVPAAAVWGQGMKTDERNRVLGQFQRSEIKVVCNCQVLIEGYDDSEIACTLLCRPVTAASAAVFGPQAFGRCMRIHPDKPYSVIIELLFGDAEEGHVFGRETPETLDKKEPRSIIEAVTGITPGELDPTALRSLNEQMKAVAQQAREEERTLLLNSLRELDSETLTRTFNVIERLSYVSSYAWVPLGDRCLHMTLGGNGDFIEIVTNTDTRWDVYVSINDELYLKSSAPSREEALRQADNWLTREHRVHQYLTNRSEGWRQLGPTPTQLGRARRLGLNIDILKTLSRGQVSDFITSALALIRHNTSQQGAQRA